MFLSQCLSLKNEVLRRVYPRCRCNTGVEVVVADIQPRCGSNVTPESDCKQLIENCVTQEEKCK